MKCQTTDLEIETLVNRIKNGDMDLQPDFQRGEIWTIQKKKKLIDSILRGWKVPPIHVVPNKYNIDEVLDGQQRLAAIRDFCDNIISIDGYIEPFDSVITQLDGMHYRDLPVEWQRKVRQYSILVVRLTEFNPQEPAELFYRLNQPSSLTSAEQRNAYIGATRDQIKTLSNKFLSMGATKELIGFSNSRLAYDEVISKFCYTLEIGTIKKKITSNDLSEQYRKGIVFSDECIDITDAVLQKFINGVSGEREHAFTFTKATLFSWFVFIRHNLYIEENDLKRIIAHFEFCRSYVKGKFKNADDEYVDTYHRLETQLPFFELMLSAYHQRSSMGSTDALSIIYRDIIISIFADAYLGINSKYLETALNAFNEAPSMNYVLESMVDTYNWGEQF